MKKLLSLFIFCSFIIIAVFLMFGDMEKLVEVNLHSTQSLFMYSLLSFSFLTADIILPVPSSLVMILNGEVLGFPAGAALSLVSGVLSSCIGFYLGRRSNPLINKFFSQKDREISDRLFNKFGNMAITISKALPIISEAVSVVSGTTSVTFRNFLYYSIAGHFIVSVIYAYAGSLSSTLNSNLVAAIIMASALFIGWLMQFMMRRKNKQREISTVASTGMEVD